MTGRADCYYSGRKSDTVSRELGVPAVVIDRWWLQREDITLQYERYCRANKDDTDLLQPTRNYYDNRTGASVSPVQEELHDLKDLDFTPEEVSGKVEVDSEEEGKGQRRRRKKVETSPYKRRKRVELPTVKIKEKTESKGKEEETRPTRGGKRKLTEQPAVSSVGVIKKSKLKVKSSPSLKTVRNTKHSDGKSLKANKPEETLESKVAEPASRKSVRIPTNSQKPNSVSVKNNDLSSDLEKEAPTSSKVTDLPVPEPSCSLKRSNTSSSTLPVDSELDDSKPIINFLENVKDVTIPATTTTSTNIMKTSSQVLVPQPPLSAMLSVPEVPEVFGPPLATSSKKNLTEELSVARSDLPQVPPPVLPKPPSDTKQLTAVNIKKEAQTGQEYIEDSWGVSEPSTSSISQSVAERYYSQIGSQPTSAIRAQSNVKTERVETATRQEPAGERERSVSPPVSAYPLVPVLEADDHGVSFPAPALRGGRGRPGIIRGQPVRGARGRGQPLRGALPPSGRGQLVRGGPGLVVRGQAGRQGVRGGALVTGRGQVRGQVRGRAAVNNMRARASPLTRGGVARPRGQILSPALRAAQPGYGRGLRGPGKGLVRSPAPVRAPAPAPAPTPLPDRLSSLNGLSVTRQKPVPVNLPKGLRLPSGVTLSHPRGIQNQPPPSRSHYNPPPAPAPVSAPAPAERKQKVSLELTAKQMEALKTLGYL